MKKIFNNMVKGSLLGAVMLLGATACSDDHFDIINYGSGDGTSNATLWENLRDNGSTYNFSKILARTIVMKDETDRKGYREGGNLTYDKFLSDAQSYTVWAPVDGSYDADYYLNLLDERDEALALDATDRIAWEKNYNVANQFVLNHIARFNYESNPDRQKVRMLNSKVSYYEAGKKLFNNVIQDDGIENINASNGTLHFLSSVSPFAYNIYDYIATAPDYSKLWAVLSDPLVDRQEFYEAGSTPGAIDENGNMVHVDSAFIHYNDILDRCGAQIRNEDSVYVAILPTDKCWEEAFAKVNALYKYGDSYCYDWNSTAGVFRKTGNDALKFNTDSLTSYNTNKAVIESAFFTSSSFSVEDKTDSAQVVNYALTADSIISTNGIIYYNSRVGSTNPMFGGKDPIKCSNGYLFALDEYSVDPAYSFVDKTDFQLTFGGYYVANVKGATSTEGTLVELNEDTRNPEVKGEVQDDRYRRFEVQGSNNLTVDIRLPNIYSTKYKISAVLVPNRTHLGLIQTDRSGNEVEEHTQFTCQIRDDKDEVVAQIPTNSPIVVDPDTIQEYVLFESVEFPKCYVNLPSGYDTFPRLRFTMSSANQIRGKGKSLNISRIIIAPVRDEEKEGE